MRIRRAFPISLALVIVAAAVILAVQLRKQAPPEPARLLPGADAFVYANLGWARKANGGKLLLPVAHDPEYDHFIQETGFDFERDLDAVAFAIHYPEKWPGGGTGGAATEPRYSEVFTAKFDRTKSLAYLKQIAQSVENYNSIDIFTIPLYGRTFRIAILSVDTVAASNHDDAAVIRGIVDRSRRLASPFGGPALLRRYYRHVQFASPFWMVARTEPLARQFDTWAALFPKPADLVISASYNPLHFPLRVDALHLRAEAWAASDDDARAIADKANTYLSMFRSAEISVGSAGTDADVKALFESLQVRQEGSRAVLAAILPGGFLRKLGESPEQTSAPAASSPQPAKRP
ncbi:MAG TPA: hypothetical protein VFL34_02625 [Candidatus Sulfotelmatobacter sp.]|nr:hypothetical protein [Candidatus Sulfotelmatobacter sp.]